jgi:GH24 family phage-related lysozyme (muramidase)
LIAKLDLFLRWTKGTDPKTGQKKDLPGLVKRRAAERKLFLGLPWSGP